MMARLGGALVAVAALAAVAGCGTGDEPADDGRIQVVAAFYPLQYVTSQVGGERVSVTGLTKPGAEPHDLELTPRQVGRVALADLVVYQSGFQPAVDDAVRREAADHALDVAASARLDEPATDGHEGHDHEAAEHAGVDPHFWLDPLRFAEVADAVAAALTRADPAGAAAYTQGAQAFRGQMEDLDREFRAGLARCATTELVTSHAAFGYLAARYGLHQEGITGLDPEAEPDPATLARIVDHVRESGATTVFAEVLVSRDVARTIARETGAEVAVLDPVEGISDESAGSDYPTVMRANLEALRKGLRCQ